MSETVDVMSYRKDGMRIVGYTRSPWTDHSGVEHAGLDWNADDEFMSDEDGETYYGLGHLPKDLFAFNVNRVSRLYDDAVEDMSPSCVQWVYFVDDPEHDRWNMAKRDEPGAFPVTVCSAWVYMPEFPDEVAS